MCPWKTNSFFLYNLCTKQISNPVSLKNEKQVTCSVVEHLPTVHEALGSINPQYLPTITTGGKTEGEEREKGEGRESVSLEHGGAGL